MDVFVCVGSSCHLRGSHKVINLMKEHIAAHRLEDQVNLGAAFCLGKCTDGVSMKVDGELVCGVNADNFEEIFSNYILERL